MKKFERDGKINFVDINNVLVGFDTKQQCCEDFGYFFDYQPHNKILDEDVRMEITDETLEKYVFDIYYFYGIELEDRDCKNIAVFRLKSEGYRTIYLHLYNVHNGYYHHGFEFKENNNILKEGEL